MAADAAAVGIEDAVNLEVGPRINEYALFVVGIVKSIGQEACLVSNSKAYVNFDFDFDWVLFCFESAVSGCFLASHNSHLQRQSSLLREHRATS